jgi:peptidoglycan/xylan/chitin deacetylase (PgdA/CDA1 family)
MADDGSGGLSSERAAACEVARRRAVRQRRIWSGVILVVACGLVVGVALRAGVGAVSHQTATGRSGGGNGHRPRHPAVQSSGPRVPSARRFGRVRNARPQPRWRRHTGPVPILVYHALGTPPTGDPYPGLYVSRREFRADMAWLARHGYQGVTLDEVQQAWYHGGRLPPKPIVITFDNGYPAQATLAPAVLAQYGWPGVLFEITVNHLSPARIRPLVARGWEVDSHSATHPDLRTLSGSALTYQVAGSRRYLQRTFHIASDNFCYPSSEYTAATIAAVRAAGYVGAVTENAGYATRGRPYQLDRFEIEGGQGVAGLAADLAAR